MTTPFARVARYVEASDRYDAHADGAAAACPEAVLWLADLRAVLAAAKTAVAPVQGAAKAIPCVSVRVAVAVGSDGEWEAGGGKGMKPDDAMQSLDVNFDPGSVCYWLTAELPIPAVADVAAGVEVAA